METILLRPAVGLIVLTVRATWHTPARGIVCRLAGSALDALYLLTHSSIDTPQWTQDPEMPANESR